MCPCQDTQWGGVGGGGADSVWFDFSPWNPKPCRIATSLFGLVLESAGICRTFVVWSQDWGLCLQAPFRQLKVRARFLHTLLRRCQLGKKADLATHLSRVC